MPDEKVNENVATVASIRARADRSVSRHQKWIERFTAQVARPRSFYVIVVLVASWIAYNLVARRLNGWVFDPPPFSCLQGLVSFCALSMTIAILTTQSRQTRDLDQRAELELQVALLSEQKVTKLIALMEELRRDMPSVANRVDPLADLMQEPVNPHEVLSAIEQKMQEPPTSAEPEPQEEPPRRP